MERRRNSTNSDSSVEPMDISAKTTSTDANSSAVLKSSDANDSDNFESDREDRLRIGRLAYRAATAAAAAASNANLPANNTENDGDDDDDEEHQYRSNEYKHQNFVRRENLRQLEANMMSMRKKFRLSMPPTKNNNNINNNGQYEFEKFHPLVSRIQASILAGVTPVESSELQTGLVDTNENTTLTNGSKGEVKYSCPICDTVSTTQHEFTEHIRSHNNADDTQNFTCKICFKVRTYSRVVVVLTRIGIRTDFRCCHKEKVICKQLVVVLFVLLTSIAIT